MSISRRKFLKNIGMVSLAIGVAGVFSFASYNVARTLYRRITHLRLAQDSPTGPLNPDTLNTLLVYTDTLLGVGVEKSRYQSFFQWHAQKVHGYKTVYEQVAKALNESARERGQCHFAGCGKEIRQEILDHAIARTEPTKDGWTRLWMAVTNQDWILLHKYVNTPVLKLFANTDALLLLGYESYPGTPRGLDNYRQPLINAGFK